MRVYRLHINWKIFRTFLFPYLAVLTVVLIIVAIAYGVSYSSLMKQAEVYSVAVLRESKELFENDLASLERQISAQLSSSQLNQFALLYNPYDSHHIGKLFTLREQINISNPVAGEFYRSYYLFTRSGLSVSTETVCSLSFFHSGIFRFAEQSYEDFYDTITRQYYYRKIFPLQEVTYKDETVKTMVCMYSIGRLNSQTGVILVVMDSDYIQGMFNRTVSSTGAQIYVFDKDGTALYQTEDSPSAAQIYSLVNAEEGASSVVKSRVDEATVYITYLRSDYTDYQYALVQPTSVFLSDANTALKLSLAFMSAILLLGLSISSFMALRSTRNMVMLLQYLQDRNLGDAVAPKGPFALLKSSIARLLNEKNALITTVSEQSHMVRGALVERLLHGMYMAPGEIESAGEKLGFPSDANGFCVVMFYYHGYSEALSEAIMRELDGRKLLLRELITQNYPANSYCHSSDYNSLEALFAFSSENEGMFRDSFDSFCENMPKSMSGNLTIAVGRICEKIDHISRSYADSRQLVQDRSYEKTGIVRWHDQKNHSSHYFYYPVEVENRLIGAVKNGSLDLTADVLASVYQENLEIRDVSSDMLFLLNSNMIGTMVKLMFQQNLAGDFARQIWERINRRGRTPHDDYKNIIQPAFMELCTHMYEQKRNKNSKIKTEVLEYISLNYSRRDFSLTMLADRFGFSEVYASQWFKAQTQENFSSFLEKTRISKAKELLLKTDERIQDIAVMVGYQSSNSFCRAFRRVTNTNAGDYREARQNKNRR
ncbi:MAG: helix-turn-helix domain-containing protein [Christensenellales bacterium]|jgi:two-component system response regulator YesN